MALQDGGKRRRIAFVGVDGSGKTVLMAAFAAQYETPDGDGYFLAAEDVKTFQTVKAVMGRMQNGNWPNKTVNQTVYEFNWSLCRREGNHSRKLLGLSFADYAGEVYRLAFGDHDESETAPYKKEIEALRRHVRTADVVLVLVNLKDIIGGDPENSRTSEMLWLTKTIVDAAFAETSPFGAAPCEVALVFTQAGAYRGVIEAAGGLEGAYRTYLPHVEVFYPNVKLFAVSAVEDTVLDKDGHEIPARRFHSTGLDGLLAWIVEKTLRPASREGGAKPAVAPGTRQTITLPGGAEMEFVWCPPGTFTMGGAGNNTHEVRLTRGFWMGKYPVTQRQWQSVMGSDPSRFKGAEKPVEMVSWLECDAFIRKVDAQFRGGRIRLPTEAEWEYACRAGKPGPYDEPENLDEVAWYRTNSENQTHPVGQKKPNDWGLCDMLGNVREWCADWYGSYPASLVDDPEGPASGSFRVLRGGAWSRPFGDCLASVRYQHEPANRYDNVGFRVCCAVEGT